MSLEEKELKLQHYSTMHSILSLTEILYFPTDGTGEGVVGEELLDWLNVIDRAPSQEDGTELSSLSQPWESPLFFPYLTKCLLRGHSSSLEALLQLLISTHPSKTIKSISTTFFQLYEQFPRSSNPRFKTELEFRQALKNFKLVSKQSLSTVEKLYQQLEGETEEMDPEESQDFLTSFRTLFSILTLSACTTNGTDSDSGLETLSNECETWQEFLITLIIFSKPLSTRQDLSNILSTTVLNQNDGRWMIDQTLLEEKVENYLFTGEITKLLKTLVSVSPFSGGEEMMEQGEGEGGEDGEWLWLATHLIDLLSHLNLQVFDIPTTTTTTTNRFDSVLMDTENGDEEERGQEEAQPELGPRESFLMSYSDSLFEFDKTLWRVCCEYWGECGRVGRKRISDLLTKKEEDGEELYDSPVIEEEGEKERNEEETTMTNGMELELVQAKKLKEMVNRKGKNVEEVLTVLGEYRMEPEMKKVCQVSRDNSSLLYSS